MREQEVRELYEAYLQVHQSQEEVEQLDEAGLPYGPVGKGFKKIPAGSKRKAMMDRANTLRINAMATSPEGDGGRGSSRGKMGEINSALMNPRLRPENRSESVSYESDMFDIILEHLVAEGYADTNESALVIMANMSEEWRQSIVEQLNPDAPGNTHSLADLYKAQEKYLKDQNKKKEPKSGAASQVKGV